ncbi:uncharacterized protein LOC119555850 [Drosophila subpulchrella]|uniref:uncharacterized protein LOC119555850 n=1 Tax=Drosophila subpulchrella TaxID=1486046 RepID=UPI0018A17105|nr:uncharacterized protein LOC119555850 [Drosophila subpulchrella]
MKWEPSEVKYTVDFDRLWLVLEVTLEWELATGELALRGTLVNQKDYGNPPVCRVIDPENQCGQYCRSIPHPIFNYVPELRSKLDGIENEQLAVQIKLDAQLLEIQNQLELEKSTLRESLQTIVTKKDLDALRFEVWHQFQFVSNKIEALRAPTNSPKTPPPHFEQIDSRFFYIEQSIEQTWTEAAVSCHRKGGYLAAIKNYEEHIDITSKLVRNKKYWLGINDEKHRNEFVSLASGKDAPYLSSKYYFICQADNEL